MCGCGRTSFGGRAEMIEEYEGSDVAPAGGGQQTADNEAAAQVFLLACQLLLNCHAVCDRAADQALLRPNLTSSEGSPRLSTLQRPAPNAARNSSPPMMARFLSKLIFCIICWAWGTAQ